MNCSLVIRACNEARHLPRLLEGIKRQTITDVEVILVDSGSRDNTVALAEACGAKIVHIAPAEFTFGRSLNFGLEAASRDLVAVASAHVYPVYPDWLERLLEPLADPQTGLAYGKQRGLPPNTSPGHGQTQFSEHQIFAQWFPEQSQPRQRQAFCNNANSAIRRALWQQNPYDETLTGLEDLAWAQWMQSQGYGLAYVAEAEIIHVHNETPRGVFNRYRREAMAFKRIYPEAHFSLYDLFRMLTANIGFDLVHATREHVLRASLASIFWFRWNQFLGTYRGYRDSATLTPELRQTFYYPLGWQKDEPPLREVEPIRYDTGRP